MAELSETVARDEITFGLPRRIHEVTATQVARAPDRIALVEAGASWSFRDLDQRVGEIATVLSSLGIRPGDRMMIGYDREFPGYGFARHKGYGTPEHKEALERLGACAIHRRSFKPVQLALGLSDVA